MYEFSSFSRFLSTLDSVHHFDFIAILLSVWWYLIWFLFIFFWWLMMLNIFPCVFFPTCLLFFVNHLTYLWPTEKIELFHSYYWPTVILCNLDRSPLFCVYVSQFFILYSLSFLLPSSVFWRENYLILSQHKNFLNYSCSTDWHLSIKPILHFWNKTTWSC